MGSVPEVLLTTTPKAVFSLTGRLPLGSLSRYIEPWLNEVLGLNRLEWVYRNVATNDGFAFFAQRLARLLGCEITADAEALQRVPATGPCVVIANHPFGAIEGVLLPALIKNRREDVRVLANYLLSAIPEMNEIMIPVDPFGGEDAAHGNRTPMREALRWLRSGGVLVVFPAGTVSHWHIRDGAVVDPEWNTGIGRLAQLARASVVPVFIEGRNSLLFQIAGAIHPRLRTALLARELLNKAGQNIAMRIGKVIHPDDLAAFADPKALTRHLRLTTYLLNDTHHDQRLAGPTSALPVNTIAVREAIPEYLLRTELEALPPEALLAQHGVLQVFHAKVNAIPQVLQEIGRLRETTFRAVGEGTGQATDIDLYDDYYIHLFIWDKRAGCIVGAYRIGMAEEILRRFGRKGLYTHSLFNFAKPVLSRLSPGLELGRSFVRLEYQRSFAPLMLLWRGIGEFVARHPDCATLFGPVSISNHYSPVSRRLLVDYLRAHSFQGNLARYVRPRRPFRAASGRAPWEASIVEDLRDIEQVSTLITRIESDHKGAPILLKHYLKMGGRLLGFNVDEGFSHALDGLILVDLRRTDPRVLARHMGEDGARNFLAHHGLLAVEDQDNRDSA